MNKLLLLLALIAAPAFAQTTTVATCPTATPGTLFSATPATPWLPCTKVVYAAPTQGQIVAQLNSGNALWQLASAVPSNDQVWTITAAAPTGTWTAISTLTFAAATPVPTPTPVPSIGVATLSWVAPTANTDGSPLTDLTSFNIYQGLSATSMAKVASTPAATLTYTVSGLSVGTYFFTVTAVNSTGVESAQPPTVSKTLAAASATVPMGPSSITVK